MGRRAKRKKLLLRKANKGVELDPLEASRVGLQRIVDEQQKVKREAEEKLLAEEAEKQRLIEEAQRKIEEENRKAMEAEKKAKEEAEKKKKKAEAARKKKEAAAKKKKAAKETKASE